MAENTTPIAATVGAITLFVSDLERSRDFYQRFLHSETVFEDDACRVFRVGETMINLLHQDSVPELVEPKEMSKSGIRAVYTLPVADVDAAVSGLEKVDLSPVSGPLDRPWGIRTANFADPDGYLWELSCELA